MPTAVYVLWWITVVLTLVVFIPLTVVLLHRLWSAAREIQLYARDALEAVQRIETNTSAISALDATVDVGAGMLPVAGRVSEKLDTIASVLEDRAGG